MANVKDYDHLCLHCNKSIEDKDDVLECTECHFSYHLGNCAGVTKQALRGKKTGFKAAWKCQTCHVAKSKTRITQEDKQERDETSTVQKQLKEIMGMLAVLTPLKEKVDELATMKQTVLEIEKSVQSMSDNYDDVLKKMKEQDDELKELRKRVTKLENERKPEETVELKKEINKLEQYGRRNNLEVHGLVETMNENLLEKLNRMADKMELPRLTTDSVEAAHRIPNKKQKTPTVIVRFVNRNERNAWLKNKHKLRSGFDTDSVYLQENMTAANRKLFFDARVKAKCLGYKFVWHKDGCSYVRKEEGTSAIRIEDEGDLAKIK